MSNAHLIKAISSAKTPLFSLFVLVMGTGLLGTVTPLQLHHNGTSETLIGLVASAYYLGFALGSFYMEPFIGRVGHIRAYATFASTVAASCMLQGLFVNAWTWLLLRLIGGYAVAGLYIVIESWLLAASTKNTRGQILALYMISLYAGQALGQFWLNISHPSTIEPFCITTIFCTLSVIPLCITKRKSPHSEEPSMLNFKKLYRISATGVIGSALGGLLLGSIYGLVPLFATQIGYDASDIALTMGCIILGGMALQYPVGKYSDQVDRRKVLSLLVLATLVTSVLAPICAHYFKGAFLVMCFLLGGFTFTIYPISISHTCDHLKPKDTLAATQSLVLAYGAGAASGPFIASQIMNLFGSVGLFIFFGLSAFGMAIFLNWRRDQSKAAPKSTRENFVVMPSTATPVARELDPRADS